MRAGTNKIKPLHFFAHIMRAEPGTLEKLWFQRKSRAIHR